MQSLLIIGSGQLGAAYQEYFASRPAAWSVRAPVVDVRDAAEVRGLVEQMRPDVIINTAAKTNIDWCEQHPRECLDVNTIGADYVGRAAQEFGVFLVHLSSGCVQESKSAQEVHTEEVAANPLCFYSWTKVWSEYLLLDRMTHRGRGSLLPRPLRGLILRPRQLLSSVVSPRNALVKMLTYTKFVDTANSCTVVDDLLRATEQLLENGATGIYNVVNPGILTPYEIARVLQEIIRPEMWVSKISKDELDTMTLARRIDAVLSTEKLARAGIVMPEIHNRLRSVVTALRDNLTKGHAATVMHLVEEETRQKLTCFNEITS